MASGCLKIAGATTGAFPPTLGIVKTAPQGHFSFLPSLPAGGRSVRVQLLHFMVATVGFDCWLVGAVCVFVLPEEVERACVAVDGAGMRTIVPHELHLAFLPLVESGACKVFLQLVQWKRIDMEGSTESSTGGISEILYHGIANCKSVFARLKPGVDEGR